MSLSPFFTLLAVHATPESATAEAVAHHGPAYWTWDWILQTNVINILLVLLVIFWVVRKFGAHRVFHTQQEKVESELNTIYVQRDQAKKNLEAVKARTANLQQEIDGILTQARQSAEELQTKLIADAKVEAEAIVARAQERMAQEEKRLLRDLQAQILMDAVALAKQQLADQPAESKMASVDGFAQRLQQLKSA